MNDLDERERDQYRPPRFMTKQEKLEQIRSMKAALQGKENNSEQHEPRRAGS
jgi:hypothetical protein